MTRKSDSILTIAISAKEKEALAAIAIEFGCEWGTSPNISELVRKIAAGELKVMKAEAPLPISEEVFEGLHKALSSLIDVVDLVYPYKGNMGHDLVATQLAAEIVRTRDQELAEHDAFYDAEVEPKVKNSFVALCPNPIRGQRYYEAEGTTEEEALQNLFDLLESSALPENTLDEVFSSAIVCEASDPKLAGYKMILTVNM